MPPAYPVRLPSAPVTRWQGTNIDSGLAPIAFATARTAVGRPMRRAIVAYDTVVRYGVQFAPYSFTEVGAYVQQWAAEFERATCEVSVERQCGHVGYG